jgi:hypothetical protein
MLKKLGGILFLLAALTYCGDDDDDSSNNNGTGGTGGGNGGSGASTSTGTGTVTCSDNTTVKLSDFSDCKTYFDELAKCCPKLLSTASVYQSFTSTTVCQKSLTKDQMNSACKQATSAISSICSTLKSTTGCQ